MAEKTDSMWRTHYYYRFRQKTSLFYSTITLLFLQVWPLCMSVQYFLTRNCSILCSCLPQTQFLSTHHWPGNSSPSASMNSVLCRYQTGMFTVTQWKTHLWSYKARFDFSASPTPSLTQTSWLCASCCRGVALCAHLHLCPDAQQPWRAGRPGTSQHVLLPSTAQISNHTAAARFVHGDIHKSEEHFWNTATQMLPLLMGTGG